jgi:hypothetical protein
MSFLNDILLNAMPPSVALLNVILLNVILPSDVLLDVVAPANHTFCFQVKLEDVLYRSQVHHRQEWKEGSPR